MMLSYNMFTLANIAKRNLVCNLHNCESMGLHFIQTCSVANLQRRGLECQAFKGNRLVNRPLSWCSIILVLELKPACDIKGTHWATHLINICSVFIWQHNNILSLLCLQCKNNSGMFIIYTYWYTRALVENYFCIWQSEISGITRVLTLTTEKRTAQGI